LEMTWRREETKTAKIRSPPRGDDTTQGTALHKKGHHCKQGEPLKPENFETEGERREKKGILDKEGSHTHQCQVGEGCCGAGDKKDVIGGGGGWFEKGEKDQRKNASLKEKRRTVDLGKATSGKDDAKESFLPGEERKASRKILRVGEKTENEGGLSCPERQLH